MAPVDVAVLAQPIAVLQPAIAGLETVQDVATLQRAERAGLARVGVVRMLNDKMAELMLDQGGLGVLSGNTSTDILSIPGNAGMSEHAIERGVVTQRRDPNRLMYFKQSRGPWMPRWVPAGTVVECIAGGGLDYCPDCGRPDCGLDPLTGALSGDPNLCPARQERVLFARCPLCAKRVWDMDAQPLTDGSLEAGEVSLQGVRQPTVELRLKARMDIHMLAFHADEARIQGLTPMPEPGQIVAVQQLQSEPQLAAPGGA